MTNVKDLILISFIYIHIFFIVHTYMTLHIYKYIDLKSGCLILVKVHCAVCRNLNYEIKNYVRKFTTQKYNHQKLRVGGAITQYC